MTQPTPDSTITLINDLRREGLSWNGIAQKLNNMHLKTKTGLPFKGSNVSSLYFAWQPRMGQLHTKTPQSEEERILRLVSDISEARELSPKSRLALIQKLVRF